MGGTLLYNEKPKDKIFEVSPVSNKFGTENTLSVPIVVDDNNMAYVDKDSMSTVQRYLFDNGFSAFVNHLQYC